MKLIYLRELTLINGKHYKEFGHDFVTTFLLSPAQFLASNDLALLVNPTTDAFLTLKLTKL